MAHHHQLNGAPNGIGSRRPSIVGMASRRPSVVGMTRTDQAAKDSYEYELMKLLERERQFNMQQVSISTLLFSRRVCLFSLSLLLAATGSRHGRDHRPAGAVHPVRR